MSSQPLIRLLKPIRKVFSYSILSFFYLKKLGYMKGTSKKSKGGFLLLAKLKTLFSFFILFGAVLLLAKVDRSFNLYNAPYLLIAVGSIGLIVSLLATHKENSLLCRVGLHRYERGSRDGEVPALYVYTCKRCSKQKKAASII